MSPNELMYMNWQNMITPENVQVSSTPSYGKFVCEPLERGFGITIGNSLRRIILSSLYGASIVSVNIDSVMHEYGVIPGVLEDVSEIILNLKQVRLKLNDTDCAEVCIKADTEGVVLAGDIISDDVSCEVLNPDQYIATLSENASLHMSMVVKLGKRYALSEENKDDDAPEGTIPVDAIFSPIKRVSYTVSEARIGQKSDYDKLTMEVWTDGSISPEDSVAYAAKILKEQMSIFINFDESIEPVIEKEVNVPVQPEINKNLYRRVDELELSVRSANCLKNADINKIHQLVNKSESEMLKTKNFGRKSLNEIKEVLNEMGLFLGMTLDGFVLPEEDMEEGE